MASSAKYARRRRRALLAAVALAALLIIIIVLIIVGISKRNSGGSNANNAPATVSPTNQPLLTPGSDPDVTVNSPTAGTTTAGTVTPTPDASADGSVMYVTASVLNVREKADSSAKIITTVKKGAEVTVLEKGDKFHKIKTSSGQTGYASKDYLTSAKPSPSTSTATATAGATPDTSKSTVMYATADVNVRKAASTGSDRLTQIKKGSKVTAFTTSNGWTYVEYQKGKYGYVSSKYLTATAPTSAPTPTPTATAAPSHATDWASVIGSADAGKIEKNSISEGYLKNTPAGAKGEVILSDYNGYKIYQVAKISGGNYYIGIKGDTVDFNAKIEDFKA